jgi:hypothetical protein
MVMKNLPSNIRVDHIDKLLKVIEKNKHMIIEREEDATLKKTYAFNSRVVIAENIDFLEAIHSDMGGELITSSPTGPFLFFE